MQEQEVIVSKFGGSSMKDAEAMLRSATVCRDRKSTVILVSATYGTTDKLHALATHAVAGEWNECEKTLFNIRESHFDILQNLTKDKMVSEKLRDHINNLETLIRGIYLLSECSLKAKDRVVSFGERLSSILFTEAMKMTVADKTITLFDSREILKTDSTFGKAKPNISLIEKNCKNFFKLDHQTIYVGQGYIGSDENSSTTTLGRGGSDYSAALFAEGVNANILEIWTDVAGIATTDPRICSDAKPIEEITYAEASEMAQYGAKILHPTTLVPAMRKNIPVFVGSSYNSHEKGTWIKTSSDSKPVIRAITKRSDQVLLTISTPKMVDEFGFMSKIFSVFTNHEISVDCVTTSEIAVAVTVDPSTISNKKFISELELIGNVEFESGLSLVSMIGNEMLKKSGLAKRVFSSIEDINVRMLSLGASAYNFNILVNHEHADQVIKSLHKEFIK